MNMEKIQTRFSHYWKLENKTPIVMLQGRKQSGYSPPVPEKIKDRWLDIDYLLASHRAGIKNSFYCGDSFPLVNPNLGPDVFGATLGADLIFEETTSYSVPFIKNWSEDFSFHEDNPWWQKIVEITEAFVEDSKGDYLVGVTDLHAGADGLVSIRGPENLCFDIVDQPEVFAHASKILLPVFKKQFSQLYAITQKYQPGTSNWMGIYKEDPWYVTSSDFICMISNDNFKELILPELLEEINFLNGNTIFHLDGPGALKHLDSLLEIPNLAGIQWVYGAGQPSAKHWLDILKKIQKAGKTIDILLQKDDIDTIFSELAPEGLCCHFDFVYTEQEANELIEHINHFYR